MPLTPTLLPAPCSFLAPSVFLTSACIQSCQLLASGSQVWVLGPVHPPRHSGCLPTSPTDTPVLPLCPVGPTTQAHRKEKTEVPHSSPRPSCLSPGGRSCVLGRLLPQSKENCLPALSTQWPKQARSRPPAGVGPSSAKPRALPQTTHFHFTKQGVRGKNQAVSTDGRTLPGWT